MNTRSLLLGLLVGGLLGFGLCRYLGPAKIPMAETPSIPPTDSIAPAAWAWPDSLDAVSAAPSSHKIVYEDAQMRILEVLLPPHSTEPIHTHEHKSLMWFAQASPMTYYVYDRAQNGDFEIRDSIQIPQLPPEALNNAGKAGDFMEPEGPHAVKNTGDEPGVAYRIEFKDK